MRRIQASSFFGAPITLRYFRVNTVGHMPHYDDDASGSHDDKVFMRLEPEVIVHIKNPIQQRAMVVELESHLL